jgi:acyl-CoA dehydrogenase
VIREWIAKSRLEIEQARLLTLRAAWKIDQVGAKAARKEIALIKVVAPNVHATVTDRAMQLFGAMGMTPDTPLADSYTWARALRYADGPDEVHLQSIAKMEIKANNRGRSAQWLNPPAR